MDADAFDAFIESLAAAAPDHIRITRRAETVRSAVLAPSFVQRIGDAEIIAINMQGSTITHGDYAGGIALEAVSIRGVEVGIFSGSELVRLSFQSVDAPHTPEIDAQLVGVTSDGGSAVLYAPSVVLRYILEDVVTHLLSATRLLFVPTLDVRYGGRPLPIEPLISHLSDVMGKPVRIASAKERADLRAAMLERVTKELAAHVMEEGRLLAAFDAAELRAAGFREELRAAGLNEADAHFLIDAGVTPEFYDDYLRRGRSVEDLVQAMAEAQASHFTLDAAMDELAEIMRASRERKNARERGDDWRDEEPGSDGGNAQPDVIDDDEVLWLADEEATDDDASRDADTPARPPLDVN